ncbi:MAG TPA: hypothetical protein PKK00_12350 [Bacteroidales bacterium]|nr:hypothetical protein [Bacteroidales bacterium]HPS18019.1 hypothetical protein [Bacteroidales bacterium]
MKNIQKKHNTKKRLYNKPSVEQIKIDNEISVFMTTTSDTPPGDPSGALQPDKFDNNPYKISKA